MMGFHHLQLFRRGYNWAVCFSAVSSSACAMDVLHSVHHRTGDSFMYAFPSLNSLTNDLCEILCAFGPMVSYWSDQSTENPSDCHSSLNSSIYLAVVDKHFLTNSSAHQLLLYLLLFDKLSVGSPLSSNPTGGTQVTPHPFIFASFRLGKKTCLIWRLPLAVGGGVSMVYLLCASGVKMVYAAFSQNFCISFRSFECILLSIDDTSLSQNTFKTVGNQKVRPGQT